MTAGILKRGELPWPHLRPAQASGRFSFDQGHPVDGGLYVQHRCFPDRYICPSLAESRYARQRVTALKDLACALGAKELRVLSVTSHERKGWLSAATPIPEIGAQVGLHVEAGAGDELRVSAVAEWAQPTRAPYVPDGLKPWLDQEPEFESLASGRMRGQLRKDAVSLTFGDSYGLSAKAVAAFESLKLDVGGEYQGVAHSTWSFEVEFWPS